MKNNIFPTYVGFLNTFCIVPAYAVDEFVFFWYYYAAGTTAREIHVCCILCIMKRVIGQVLNALPLLLGATLHRKVELGL